MGYNMSETNYRIKYKKGDFEVDVQGDKAWVETKFKELTAGKVINEGERPGMEVLPGSLVEFLKAKGSPIEHNDIVLGFSYWLSKKKGFTSYNAKDIEDCYVEARISKPANINDAMNANQGKGYLMTTEKKDRRKAWIITQSGEKLVKASFKE